MLKDYIDFGFLSNPLGKYFKWLGIKAYYQIKNWGKHLRISYMASLSNTTVGKYNLIGKNTIVVNSSIGDFTYIAENGNIFNASIGKYCSVGPNVRIAPGKHPTSVFVSTHPSLYSNPGNLIRNFVNKSMFNYNSNVTVGNDVWIGVNAVIADGITIGDGAVIAANSIVTTNIEPYMIVGGNPAKPIKKRFEDDQVSFLLEFKWWDKSEEFISDNIEAWWAVEDFTTKFL